jgi:hypothetical protein
MRPQQHNLKLDPPYIEEVAVDKIVRAEGSHEQHLPVFAAALLYLVPSYL